MYRLKLLNDPLENTDFSRYNEITEIHFPDPEVRNEKILGLKKLGLIFSRCKR